MNTQYDTQDVAQLLSKFMAGTTSLDEEQTLAQYFRTHEVNEGWKEYKEMFALFDSGETGFELKAGTSGQPSHGDSGDIRKLPKVVREKPKPGILRWIAAVAAGILLLLVFHIGKRTTDEKPTTANMEEPSSPQPVSPITVEEKPEELLAEVQPTKPPVKKRRKSAQPPAQPAEVTMSAEATIPAKVVEEYAMTMAPMTDPYADIEAEMRDIRSRGECIEAMVAKITSPY